MRMLLEKIENDLKKALKDKDTDKISTLRFLKAAIQNLAIEKKGELKEEDIISVIKRQIKQRKDSIEQFNKGGRTDLAEKESRESAILQAYLPKQLTQEQLMPVVREVIASLKADSPKDIGRVMKALLDKLKGQADAKTVSQIVGQELSKSEPAEGKEQDK
jgi:hypothetical protein